MRPMLTSALVAAVALAVLPTIPQRAEAGTGVLRCQMPDGSAAYTNKSCNAFGAKAAPLPADVIGRIARDQRREAKLGLQSGNHASTADALGNQLAGIDVAAPGPARRPLASGCAISPQQLAQDLKGSVALGDVNRIAESFDWAGMGNEEAQRVMARLQQIARRPVRDAEYFDVSVGDGMFADASNVAPDGAAGLLQVTFDAGDGDSIVDYGVRRDEGCYFLHY